jgi:photosystem II stability/assembly factor-like uncharacterized protein
MRSRLLAILAVGLMATACAALHPPTSSASGPRVESPSPTINPTEVGLSAPSADVVWALVDYVYLYRSGDKGSHWEARPMPSEFGVRPAISFIDDHEGWLLAKGSPTTQCQAQLADIWHTTDAGATWQNLGARVDKTQCKNGIWFFDAKHGFVSAWDQNRQPTVYRTADGGDHWAFTTLQDPAYFQSQRGGFTLQVDWMKQLGSTLYLEALGSQDRPDIPHDNQFILRSTDGGASWTYVTKTPSRAVVVITESRWLDFTAPAQAFESVNGGQQFHQYASDFNTDAPGSTQFVFADAHTGYASGAGRLQRTLDGGLHWTRFATPGVSAAPTPTPTSTPASSTRTSPCVPVAPPPPLATWQAFTNAQYGFAIAYPPGYTLKSEGGANPATGWLAEFRAVDSCYLDVYPPGQVEMGVYTKDADTLTAWVNKHSVAKCTDPGFFPGVSNMRSVTVAGRDALAFDDVYTGCEFSGVVHTTVLLLGSGNVFRIDWWATDPNYAPTLQAIADQMLASLKG